MELFSDNVLQIVYEKMKFIEHRSPKSCMVFQFKEDEIELISLNVKNGMSDLATPESIHDALVNRPNEIALFKTTKKYNKKREIEIQENNESDNDISIIFPVLQRPQGIDLAFRDGAIKTEPSIPRPNEQFLITGRIDNLGSTDAMDVGATLWLKNDLGWTEITTTKISLVVGQGASQVAFAYIANEVGPIELKITIINTTTNLFSQILVIRPSRREAST